MPQAWRSAWGGRCEENDGVGVRAARRQLTHLLAMVQREERGGWGCAEEWRPAHNTAFGAQ